MSGSTLTANDVPAMGEIVTIMDDHGRQHQVLLKPGGARLSSGWIGDTEPVDIVRRYSPAREVACQICGVPYGALGVAGRGEDVRTHEIRVDSRDGTCFLPRIISQAEAHPWDKWTVEKAAEKAEARAAEQQNGASA